MKRVLLAWELGAGYGHLVKLGGIARALQAAGLDCLFAVRQLESAAETFGADPVLRNLPLLQSPLRIGIGKNPVALQLSYASLLHNTGFDDPASLAARIRAWRALLVAFRIDALVVDHSPIAIIAADSLGLPVCAVGTGFTLPPLTAPFPSFRADLDVRREQLVRNESQVLLELNLALERLALPPYPTLQRILAPVRPALCTYAELDHYTTPRSIPFLGMPDFSAGAPPRWPGADDGAPKVFAYLRAYPQLDALLAALSASGARVLVRAAEIPVDRLKPFVSARFAVMTESVHMRQAAESCDAFVHYGAHGTVAEMLLAGKPGVVWAGHFEQALIGRRAEQLGAAINGPSTGAFDVGAALDRALNDAAMRTAAERFSARYHGVDRGAILPAIAADVLRLLRH